MKLRDEAGRTWTVRAGDPANSIVNSLKKHGLTLIVLPTAVFLEGLDALTNELECGTMEDRPVDKTRLQDCLQLLRE